MKNILCPRDVLPPCSIEVTAGTNTIKVEKTARVESVRRKLPLQISPAPVYERAMPAISAFALPIRFEESSIAAIAGMARSYTRKTSGA